MKKKLFFVFNLLCTYCAAIEQLPYCDSNFAMICAKKYLPNSPIIIECGGFDGYDSAKLAKFWPNGEIYTFEPIPSLFEKVLKVSKEYPNIHPFNIALGDFTGTANFYVSKYNGNISGSSSLLAPKEHLTRDLATIFEDVIPVNVVLLDTWAIENHIQNVDYLWLDMQGYELNMLKTSKIALTAKLIYIEVEFMDLYANQYLFKDVHEWMTANNFELIAKDFTEVNIDFGNALYMNKSYSLEKL